jgi:hypothetical protein
LDLRISWPTGTKASRGSRSDFSGFQARTLTFGHGLEPRPRLLSPTYYRDSLGLAGCMTVSLKSHRLPASPWSFYILDICYLLGQHPTASPPRPGETGAFFGAERGSTLSAPRRRAILSRSAVYFHGGLRLLHHRFLPAAASILTLCDQSSRGLGLCSAALAARRRICACGLGAIQAIRIARRAR